MTTDVASDPLDDLLASQAKQAIAAGKDPAKVQGRLDQINAHLNEHPDIRAQALAAIQGGKDPGAVTGRLAQMSVGKAVEEPPESEQPGLLSRVGSDIGGMARQVLTHPVDAVTAAVSAPVKSLMTAMAPDAAELKPGSLGYDAMFARSGLPGNGNASDLAVARTHTVTPAQRAVGTAQTAANLIAPGVSGAVASRIASPTIGALAGLAASGGTVGAAYRPDDPLAGATEGAIIAPAGKLAGQGASGIVSRARNLPPGTLGNLALSLVPSRTATALKAFAKLESDRPPTVEGFASPMEQAAEASGGAPVQTKLRSLRNAPSPVIGADEAPPISPVSSGTLSQADREALIRMGANPDRVAKAAYRPNVSPLNAVPAAPADAVATQTASRSAQSSPLSRADIAAGLAKDDADLEAHLYRQFNPPQADLIAALHDFAAQKAAENAQQGSVLRLVQQPVP